VNPLNVRNDDEKDGDRIIQNRGKERIFYKIREGHIPALF
jgi:hypothetical protein